MRPLHYWIGLKKAIATIRKAATFCKQTPDNKAITRECLVTIYVFCSTLLDSGIGGSRTPVAFKMKLFVTKVNGWKLLVSSQRVPSYMWQGS